MESSKKKNIFLAVFIVTTIIAVGFAVFLGIMENKGSKENLELQTKVNELTIKAEKYEKSEKYNNASNIDNDNEATNNESNEGQSEKIVEKYGILKVDSANCLNKKSDDTVYLDRLNVNEADFGVSAYKENNSTNSTIKVNVDFDVYRSRVNPTITHSGTRSELHTFGSKIVDIHFGRFGQTTGSEVIFCLTEDGSLYYLHLGNAVKNLTLGGFEKLDEVGKIVSIKDATSGANSNGMTTVAFNENGKFYDLYYVLQDKGVL